MSQPKFIIIENDVVQVRRLKSFLIGAGYPEESIWPPGELPDQVFSTWPDARAKLIALESEGWRPSRECCVLLVDLSLSPGPGVDPVHGILEITENYSAFYEHYVVVAYSQAGVRVSANQHFDGFIQKSDIGPEDEGNAQLVKHSIKLAVDKWSQRTHKPGPSHQAVRYRLVDSSEARLAVAALGEPAIDYTITRLTRHWTNVRARAVAGGLSGAFVLRVDGQNAGDRSVICKIARDDVSLEHEYAAWERARDTVAVAGLIAPLQDRVQRIPPGRAKYLTLAAIPGRTFEEVVRSGGVVDRALTELRRYFVDSARVCKTEASAQLLAMTAADRSRIEAAIRQLHLLGVACTSRGLPAGMQVCSEHERDALCALLENWEERLAVVAPAGLPGYPQHGDFNARNILLSTTGQPTVIDWARYRPWPVAYDVQRLHLQLILRASGTDEMDDYFVDDVAWLWRLWSELSDDDLGTALTVPQPRVARLIEVIDALRRLRGEVIAVASERVVRTEVVRACHAGVGYDALRIAAYTEVSPFKRLFFLHVATEAAAAAGLIDRHPRP